MDLPHFFSTHFSTYSLGSAFKLIGTGIITVVWLAVYSCGTSSVKEDTSEHPGALNFKMKCALCHGLNGDKQLSGAKKLVESSLSVEEITELITNGKRQMPAFKAQLSEEQIAQVAAYAAQFQEK